MRNRDDKTGMLQKRRTCDINPGSCVAETTPCRAQIYKYKYKRKYKYIQRIQIQIQIQVRQKLKTRTGDINLESCVALLLCSRSRPLQGRELRRPNWCSPCITHRGSSPCITHRGREWRKKRRTRGAEMSIRRYEGSSAALCITQRR